MCGITGAVEFKGLNHLNFKNGGELHNYIASRGPDFYAYEVADIQEWKVTFGHSRLAIIDLTAASNQPMISDDGRYMLTFNGEIYNYKEIKEELITLGFLFATEGDTEVLLKAWEAWGQKCLSKFNGMFAFGILDKHCQELFLVRDRFGVKPLLYGYLDNGQLLFSSSIAAVAKQVGEQVDLEYCSTGIRYGFFEGNKDASPFKKVKYVMPGSILKFTLGRNLTVEEQVWYSLEEEVDKRVVELINYSEEELIEKGKILIQNATSLRLRSDVPLAVSLSGGVDSSSIAAIAKLEVNNLVGFCYGSPKNKKSEGPIVDNFVKERGIDIHYIHPEYSSKELGDLLDRTSAAQEAPFFGLSILAQQEVYKEVHQQGFKVLLGGQGGDEIFAGYRKFFLIALQNAWDKKNIIDSLSYLHSFGILLLQGIGDYKLYWQQRDRYIKKTGKDLSFLNALPSSSVDLLGHTTLRKRQISDVQNYSIPSLLRYEDRNSMSFSIESRLPLMDYRLVEFAIALEDRMKIKQGYGKWALREIMKSTVPAYILKSRVKRGFDVTQNWISTGVGDRIRANLLENKNKVKDYVSDLDKLENSLKDENLNNNSNLLYEAMLLNFLVDPIKVPVISRELKNV
jgi:asparagine synthase (glutamine-hydrolysing)